MVQPHHRRKLHRGRQDPFPPHRERGAQAGGTSKGVLTSGAGIQLRALCGTILLSRHGLVLRKRLNYSQSLFAALLRANFSTLRNWEQAREAQCPSCTAAEAGGVGAGGNSGEVVRTGGDEALARVGAIAKAETWSARDGICGYSVTT